jgi:hypothetical protein
LNWPGKEAGWAGNPKSEIRNPKQIRNFTEGNPPSLRGYGGAGEGNEEAATNQEHPTANSQHPTANIQ